MIVAVITCVMRMAVIRRRDIVLVAVAMSIIQAPGVRVIQHGKGSGAVRLGQPPGRDQCPQQDHQGDQRRSEAIPDPPGRCRNALAEVVDHQGEAGVVRFILTSGGGYNPLHKVISMHIHETHPAVIKRLRRAGGHLSSVVQMLEDGKPCLDVVQQLQAVEKAITQAKKTLIQDHLDHCLSHMLDEQGQTQTNSLDEFRQITKYL